MPHRAGAQQQRLAQRRATAAHSPPALSGVVRNAYAHRGPDVVRKTHTKQRATSPPSARRMAAHCKRARCTSPAEGPVRFGATQHPFMAIASARNCMPYATGPAHTHAQQCVRQFCKLHSTSCRRFIPLRWQAHFSSDRRKVWQGVRQSSRKYLDEGNHLKITLRLLPVFLQKSQWTFKTFGFLLLSKLIYCNE